MRLITASFLAIALLGTSSALAKPKPQPHTPPPPPAQAQPAAPVSGPEAVAQLAADPLNTIADYAYIMDGDTGMQLYSKRGDEQMVPASMSKLMLFYLVFERIRDGRLKLEDEFPVSEKAWRLGAKAGGTAARSELSTMFLDINSKVSIDNLLKGAIIVSGNDACIVLAEGIAGSEEGAVKEMTARAHELGLTHSTFANVTGLDDPGQRMSAGDIAKLSYLIIKNFPQFYGYFSEKDFTWHNIHQDNRNPLLTEIPGADGVKTGHLDVSGFGLVGSAVQDGKRRIIVLNGLKSATERKTEGARVMRSAFADFKTAKLVDKGAQVATAPVWLGEEKSVPLIATQDASAGFHVSAMKGVKSQVVFKTPLYAPVKQGDIVGDLIISAPGTQAIHVPVAAGKSVNQLGLIGKAMAGLKGE